MKIAHECTMQQREKVKTTKKRDSDVRNGHDMVTGMTAIIYAKSELNSRFA